MVRTPSATFMFGDSSDREYTKRGDRPWMYFYVYYDYGPEYCALRHGGGGNFVFLDGHAEYRLPGQVFLDPMWWRDASIHY